MEDLIQEILYILSKCKIKDARDKEKLLYCIDNALEVVEISRSVIHKTKIDDDFGDLLFELERLVVEVMVNLSKLSYKYRDNQLNPEINKKYLNVISNIKIISVGIIKVHSGYAYYIYPEDYYDILKVLKKLIKTDKFGQYEAKILNALHKKYKDLDIIKKGYNSSQLGTSIFASHLIFTRQKNNIEYTFEISNGKNKSAEKLDKKNNNIYQRCINKIAENPTKISHQRNGIKKHFKGWQCKIDDFRLIYAYDKKNKHIRILHFNNRGNIGKLMNYKG